jgi:molybdate-binding protein
VLAVAAGKADVGITTHAWASLAGLSFEPIGAEAYELVVPAERLGDAPVTALCELLQSGRLRRQLRERFGYGVTKTGELRSG